MAALIMNRHTGLNISIPVGVLEGQVSSHAAHMNYFSEESEQKDIPNYFCPDIVKEH